MLGLAPARVLEVGTHLGASTTAIAAALADAGRRGRLTTVDRIDVNDPRARHWAHHDGPAAPRELVARLGATESVEFVVADSLAYFEATDRRFDLVFLDGNHAAPAVYCEIPAALATLAPGGTILLHDFFPSGMP